MFGLIPVFDHHIFKFVVQKFLCGTFAGGVDVDEIGEDTEGLEAACLFAFDSAEKAFDGLGGVGVVRDDVFERFLLGTEAGGFAPQIIDGAPHLLGESALGGKGGLGLAALNGDGLEFELAIGDGGFEGFAAFA